MFRFSSGLTYATREFARVRNDVNHADAAEISSALPIRERSAALKASVYVWLAATLERVVNESLRELLLEINASGVTQNAIRTSLFGLICDAEFASISDRNRQTSWPMRTAIFGRLVDPTPPNFSPDTLPLDGRTLRAEHFETLWLVFGFPGPALPDPRHRTALKDLAEGRNNVAHGNVDPVIFGKAKATSDVRNLTNHIEDITSHLFATMDDYLNRQLYRR